jgi:hypothetical protein
MAPAHGVCVCVCVRVRACVCVCMPHVSHCVTLVVSAGGSLTPNHCPTAGRFCTLVLLVAPGLRIYIFHAAKLCAGKTSTREQ